MIVLMGATGSGKSLQSKLLADEHGYTWISTGRILRSLMTSTSRQEMQAGELVDDQEMIKIMAKTLGTIKPNQQVVLDGFPRTMAQADWLIKRAKAGDFKLSIIFNFNIPQAVIRDRLINRGRFDDTETAIKQRFKEYEAVTLPIIKRLQGEGYQIVDIDAAANPRTVHENIVKAINKV
jgi:adenylate kinase